MIQNAPVNVTIPVFNRYESTLKVITAIYKSVRSIPFVISVVDNGSDAALRARLVELKHAGIIDNLFLMPMNMGISCACNVSWQMVESDYYMKLDNDIVMNTPDWLPRLFALWRHGDPVSTLGGACSPDYLKRLADPIETPDGLLGICTTILPGQAILIPKPIWSVLGYWNEEYGLYGGEDGDYGFRMVCAGFQQYYYNGPDYYTDLGLNDAFEYSERNVDKEMEHKRLFVEEDGREGLFNVNRYLFSMCIRNWRIPLRYKILDMDSNFRVHLQERREYAESQAVMRSVQKMITVRQRMGVANLYTEGFIAELKRIFKEAGQGFD